MFLHASAFSVRVMGGLPLMRMLVHDADLRHVLHWSLAHLAWMLTSLSWMDFFSKAGAQQLIAKLILAVMTMSKRVLMTFGDNPYLHLDQDLTL